MGQYWSKIAFLYPAFDTPGSRRNIAIRFGMEKLQLRGYPTV